MLEHERRMRTAEGGLYPWLRQFEPGSNSADANRLLDRIEHLREKPIKNRLLLRVALIAIPASKTGTFSRLALQRTCPCTTAEGAGAAAVTLDVTPEGSAAALRARWRTTTRGRR